VWSLTLDGTAQVFGGKQGEPPGEAGALPAITALCIAAFLVWAYVVYARDVVRRERDRRNSDARGADVSA
jgi:hypothetical protein